MIKIDRGIQIPPHSRIAHPSVPVCDPRFKWTAGSDVVQTWKRFGYKPTNSGEAIHASR